jgi:hypothetical protein
MGMVSKRRIVIWAVLVLIFAFSMQSWAGDALLKPYVLAYSGEGSIDAKSNEVRGALLRNGFQIAGEYSPYKGAHIIVVTSDSLRSNAAQSQFGAYGVVQRISLTETGKGLQIAYTNPVYMAEAYRLKGSLASTAEKLEKALGKKEFFGSKDGIKAEKLRSYRYMMFMPYFTDQVELAKYASHEIAIQTVESNLAAGKGGTVGIYRVDIPGKKETVFGVGLREGEGADATVMKTVDFGALKQTGHLPYELIVSDGAVYMMHGKFRIAVNFPDLTMGTFMKISSAPSGIENALKQVAAGK